MWRRKCDGQVGTLFRNMTLWIYRHFHKIWTSIAFETDSCNTDLKAKHVALCCGWIVGNSRIRLSGAPTLNLISSIDVIRIATVAPTSDQLYLQVVPNTRFNQWLDGFNLVHISSQVQGRQGYCQPELELLGVYDIVSSQIQTCWQLPSLFHPAHCGSGVGEGPSPCYIPTCKARYAHRSSSTSNGKFLIR